MPAGAATLQRLTADQPDRPPFDGQRPRADIDDDGREIRVLGEQFDDIAPPMETLDRHLLIESGNDDLAVAHLATAVNRQQIAIQNAGVDHRQAAHAQQKIGARRKQAGIDRVTSLDILDRQDRTAGGDAADQWQAELFDQPDATRRTWLENDDPFLGQRLEVFFSGVVRGKAKSAGNLGPRWRRAEILQRTADEIEYFLLAWGQRTGLAHRGDLLFWNHCIFVQFLPKKQATMHDLTLTPLSYNNPLPRSRKHAMIDQRVDDFSLPATGGQTFTLSACLGSVVVLYFYPKDSTPGCTTEAQQFRDLYPRFVEAGAAVVGISRDGLKSHENFKARQELPFALLSDADEMLCSRFAVIKMKTMYGKQVRGIERSTFVIDRQGVLRREWRGLKVDGHAQAVLDFVSQL